MITIEELIEKDGRWYGGICPYGICPYNTEKGFLACFNYYMKEYPIINGENK